MESSANCNIENESDDGDDDKDLKKTLCPTGQSCNGLVHESESDVDLDECFQTCKAVTLKAGQLIRDAFDQAKEGVQTKSSLADLVTDTDHQTEESIISMLHEKYPSHKFIGEETTQCNPGTKCVLTDEPTWVIDPIDGTSNFVHRFPYVAISIALLINKKAVIGMVYNPILDQMYSARPGNGAFLNGSKLRVTDVKALDQALLCAEFGSSRDPNIMDAKFRSIRNVIMRAAGLRAMGSAALHMCMVASGDLDAHFTYGIHIWDIAAGDLIVREAGGVVCDTDGGSLNLMERRVLCAATPELAQQISENIERIEFEQD